MKKRINHAALLITIIMGLHSEKYLAQSPTWQWGRSAGATGSEAAMGSALDASGNLYVVGWYTSANITFGTITLTNPGSFTGDIFLVKYNGSGNVLWAKTYGGTDGESGNGVAVDASGNVYITGLYTSTIMAMDSYTLTNSSAGSSDMFVAKINPSGNVIWAKTAGGNSIDKGNGITVDPFGNVYTVGSFNSASINFGTGVLTNAGTGADFFLVKHDSNGNTTWARSAGGSSQDIGNSVAVDSLGDIYSTGQFASPSLNFGTGALSSAGAIDLFVVKYNGAGTAVWSARSGGSLDDFGNGIAVKKNNVYVTGGFSSSSVAFGTTTLTNSSTGLNDVLLAKYDLNGNSMWAKSSGGSDSEAGQGVAVNSQGNAYVTGYFISSSLNFGTVTINNSTPNYRDLFIVAYDGSGNSLWGIANGSSFDETAYCISVNGTGSDVYIGGVFNSSSIVFGPSTIFKGCGDDVFVAKLFAPAVGIKEMHLSEQINVYPNPTEGKFRVDAEGQIMFYNTLGENILNKKLVDNNEFDFTSFPKGIFFYKIMTEKKGVYTGRVVVQ